MRQAEFSQLAFSLSRYDSPFVQLQSPALTELRRRLGIVEGSIRSLAAHAQEGRFCRAAVRRSRLVRSGERNSTPAHRHAFVEGILEQLPVGSLTLSNLLDLD